MKHLARLFLPALLASHLFAAPPQPKFQIQELDAAIQIGYGLAIADVDGDGRADVLLADKKQFVWYRNPGSRDAAWSKHLLAENLTKNDNVCIAARDIDGDGKCEIAVGAEWNPGDTVGSGAVFYLVPPADRTQPWDAVKFPEVEPTTHRMKWVKTSDKDFQLVVVPLHGRGNKNAEGVPVKILAYQRPANPRDPWPSRAVPVEMHATHNFEAHDGSASWGFFVGRESIARAPLPPAGGAATSLTAAFADFKGAGEIRSGKLPGGKQNFLASIEPMHGNQLVVYPVERDTPAARRVLTDQLADGHALATGDLLGIGSDQIVVGWRGNGANPAARGLHLWTPLDPAGTQWRDTPIDDERMACEDVALADLDADGHPDIIAAGRATKNVRVYWNTTGK